MAISVRWLTEDDWEILIGLRLRALADAPYAFTSTVERESAFEPELWRARTARSVVAFADDAPAGLASLVSEEGKAQLVGMWVAPEARGTSAADAIVDGVAERARADGHTLWLCVYSDNPRARRFYERYGFVADGEMCDIPGTRTLVEMRLLED